MCCFSVSPSAALKSVIVSIPGPQEKKSAPPPKKPSPVNVSSSPSPKRSSSQTDNNNKVSEIANTAFVSLDEDTLVAEAAKAIYEQESCTIIVTRYDSTSGQRFPLGIVTERDIIFREVAQNKGPFKTMLKDIMSSPIITIDSDKPAKEALIVLKQNRIHHLPVVNKGNNLIGLVTTDMIARKSV